MYNSERPEIEELPSTAQLLRSTIIALGVALAILVTVVLPAEYGIDPTGAGRALGLTPMGETKKGLEREAEQDRKSNGRRELWARAAVSGPPGRGDRDGGNWVPICHSPDLHMVTR